MLFKRKIYLTLHSNITDTSLLKEMMHLGLDGFLLSSDSCELESYDALLQCVKTLAQESHLIPEIILRVKKYDHTLIPVLSKYPISSLVLPFGMDTSALAQIKKELTTYKLSHIHLYSTVNLEYQFIDLLQTVSRFKMLLIDRSDFDHSKHSKAEGYIQYQQLLSELGFAKMPIMTLCPVHFRQDESLISEFSDIIYCVKSGSKAICLSYNEAFSAKHLDLLKQYCDVIYASTKPDHINF